MKDIYLQREISHWFRAELDSEEEASGIHGSDLTVIRLADFRARGVD